MPPGFIRDFFPFTSAYPGFHRDVSFPASTPRPRMFLDFGWLNPQTPTRRFLAPEVVQTSTMDCGPAALKSLLEGFGVPVHYARLREACQTGVDGTSIDTLEEVARQLGLRAEQVLVPLDHLLLPESQSLPALVVARQPSGLLHFQVLWRVHGNWVQIMDPATGRRWLPRERFLSQVHDYVHEIDAADWLDWARTDGFLHPLAARWRQLGAPESRIKEWREQLANTEDWREIASLDAATRMTQALVRNRGLRAGTQAADLTRELAAEAMTASNPLAIIPANFWNVLPNEHQPGGLTMRGAVILQVAGVVPEEERDPEEPISPELASALHEPTPNPWPRIQALLRMDGLAIPSIMLFALLIAVVGVTLEALLLKGLLDIGDTLGLVSQRIDAMNALLLFFLVLLALELPLGGLTDLVGRRLEIRLRIAFWEKIPRLGDRYFHSRLTADMSQRAHELRELRTLPQVVMALFRHLWTFLLIGGGLIWLNPSATLLVFLAAALSIGLSLLTQPWLREEDLRLRTQVGALSRFYLDALQGLLTIRAHNAGRALRHEHESLLVEWQRSGLSQARARLLITAGESLAHTAMAVGIVFHYIGTGGDTSGVLVLIYWTLRLPETGRALADTAQLYPLLHNRMLRLLEPLSAPEENPPSEQPDPFHDRAEGMAIQVENTTVLAGGQPVLTDLNLSIAPGEHIAVVGASGAGKTTLAGLLLGWYPSSHGRVSVDGIPLGTDNWQWLRRHIAWVDPAVRLWNRTLAANLRYGNPEDAKLDTVIDQAELRDLVNNLPEGLDTVLGEGGALVSGGEGQRIRLGRALLRPHVRLVILDEPFRGLDRPARSRLLRTVREHWRDVTLLLISHDVGDTQDFDRILVMDQGTLVEDGPPETLQTEENGYYHALLAAEAEARERLWHGAEWRHWWLEEGRLRES